MLMKLIVEKIALYGLKIKDWFDGTKPRALIHSRSPKHVAIIMDGNNRWAKKRALPGFAGHQAGVDAIRSVLQACNDTEIEALTLFAFSSENWDRPKDEVSSLMSLFLTYLQKEISSLHEQKVRLRFIGRRDRFSNEICQKMEYAESLTLHNAGKTLVLAVDFGGRWDISNAVATMASDITSGQVQLDDVTELTLSRYLSLSDLPDVDLCIRTGGECRISNFLLWQLSYSELYFTDCLWPDFNEIQFRKALLEFSLRQRRYGLSAEQVLPINDMPCESSLSDLSADDTKHSSAGQ